MLIKNKELNNMKVKKINTMVVETIQGATNAKEIVKEINSFNIVYSYYSRHTDKIYIQGDITVMCKIWKRISTIDWSDNNIFIKTVSVTKGNYKNFFNNTKNVEQVA
jgi:hypothetical protein